MKKIFTILLFLFSTTGFSQTLFESVSSLLKKDILSEAQKNLSEKPVTVTSYQSERSAGGRHDFFSEGDYWWPDSSNPNGPYIQKRFTLNKPSIILKHGLWIPIP